VRQSIGNIGGPSVPFPSMHAFGRIVVLLLTLGALYSGPVAACVCPDDMPAMPCCPDEPLHSGDHDSAAGPAATVCSPTPADLLPATPLELAAPIAIAGAPPPPWQTHGPPQAAAPPAAERQPAPPIYLTTLRLRI
jgi:hypothetical protein